MRSSKDLAKRLRFDLFPRRDFFRRRYFLVGAAAAVAGVATWLALTTIVRQRQYMPGPVSATHATFGDRCETCHTPFHAVANESCQECHGARTHSAFETGTPACADCHREHRAGVALAAVANRPCIGCHGDLQTSNPQPAIQRAVATFAAHPQFAPLRAPAKDEAAIRFNHALHLTSARVMGEKLACASCHVLDTRRRLMQPVKFAAHCQRCHRQEVTGAGRPGDPDAADTAPPLTIPVEALHDAPEVIRPDLLTKLVAVAVDHPEIFERTESSLPGIRDRPPVDASRTLRDYRARWIERLEGQLYAPFDPTPPLLDHNDRCFLCHVQSGTRAAGELPALVPTKIPARWLQRGEFAHGAHEMLVCRTCHSGVEQSAATADTNLPAREICARCHVDATPRSAGAECALCHLYHDTSKDWTLHLRNRKEVALDVLDGSADRSRTDPP